MSGSVLAILAMASASLAEPAAGPAPVEVVLVSPLPSASRVPSGTPVRLMVVREITSRTAKIGDRFKLRVDEPVLVNGQIAIPIGTAAWGEIVSLEKNAAAGKGGRLGARLLFVELPDGNFPLTGDMADRGDGNGTQVGLAILGFGLFGLLNAGDSARFRAGYTFTAFTQSMPSSTAEVISTGSPVIDVPIPDHSTGAPVAPPP